MLYNLNLLLIGGEFIGNRQFFKERNILFRPKRHQTHKAALVNLKHKNIIGILMVYANLT